MQPSSQAFCPAAQVPPPVPPLPPEPPAHAAADVPHVSSPQHTPLAQ
jgi:hypothetical protein